jgi:hypothetical protein
MDGDHSYDAARADFEMYCDLVSDGGIIAIHDIHSPKWENGVVKLWEELTTEYENTTEVSTSANKSSDSNVEYELGWGLIYT